MVSVVHSMKELLRFGREQISASWRFLCYIFCDL